MCELFGLSSNRAVKISFTWRGFRRRGSNHRDGWGVAWYLDGGLAGLVKEPRPAPESPIARLMVQGVRSRIVISHVRLASQGKISYVNTHPFIRRLWNRDWVVARALYWDVSETTSTGFLLSHFIWIGGSSELHRRAPQSPPYGL